MRLTDSATKWPPQQHLLPVPVPDWSRARPAWGRCWPTHVYGFGCAFLLAAALALAVPSYCFRCRRRSPRPTVATSTVNGIVGVVCLAQSCVLLIDAYHSTGRLPVALVQLVHGLVFPGVVATLTVVDRVLSALVKPRPSHSGAIKHPRLIAAALAVYLLSTCVAHVVISARPRRRLWLVLLQAVSLAWGCAAVFIVACQCVRLARFARLTARSRRQTAVYVRAKRRLTGALDDRRRCQLLRHVARLRVARTKADEFAHQHHQQQQLDEQGFTDVDLQTDTSTTESSGQPPSDVELNKTTDALKLPSHSHFRCRRRGRRRRHVTGRRSTCGGRDAVRDLTVTALAAARLLWSPSSPADSDVGQCDVDRRSSWRVCLQPTEYRPNDAATRRRDRGTSVTGTNSDDDLDNDAEDTDNSSESRQQHSVTDATSTEARPVSENITASAEHVDESRALTCRQQSEAASFGVARFVDASSTTCLFVDGVHSAVGPLTRRLTSAAARLLRHWRNTQSVGDVESRGRIACVADSYTLDARSRDELHDVRHDMRRDMRCDVRRDVLHDVRHDTDGGSVSSSVERRRSDVVVFENRAYDNATGCEETVEAVDSMEPCAGVQAAAVSSGYLADTELDSVDWRHEADAAASSLLLPTPGSSLYLGLSRLRGGRTVRLVWRTASVAVTSAGIVCCLHIYSMLGVFGVLSNHRPAPAWPWLNFQTLYRYSNR